MEYGASNSNESSAATGDLGNQGRENQEGMGGQSRASPDRSKATPESLRGGARQQSQASQSKNETNQNPKTTENKDAAADSKGDKHPKNEEKRQADATEKIKRKIKVDGQDVEVDVDEVLRDFQKYKSADQKFREAAENRRRAEEILKKFQEGDESIFEDPSVKFDRSKLAEKWLMDDIMAQMEPEKSAEALRIEELEKELGIYKERDETETQKKEREEYESIVTERKEAIAKTFQEAIAITPLAKDPSTSAEVVREMAMYMRICKEAGHDVTPQELSSHVEQRFMNSYKALTENMSGEDLVNFLGKGIIKKLREYDLAQLEKRYQSKQALTDENWEQKPKSRIRDFSDPRSLIRK